MSDEVWQPIPGHGGLHERSSLGRVRTTAAGSGAGGVSLLWLLLLLAPAVVVYKAQLVNTVATAVTLTVCAIPAGWVLYQCAAEWRLRRLYDRSAPVPTRVQPRALTSRVPLAIEAVRPKVTVIECEAQRKMER